MCQKRILPFQRERARALIQETNWFSRASGKLVDDLINLAELCSVPKGEYLFRSGDRIDSVALPFSGKVEILVDTPTGEQVLFAYVTLGEWLGDPVVNRVARHWLTAYCKEDFTGFFFDAKAFSQVLRSHPEVYEDILISEVERKKNIFDLMSTRLPHNTEQRLAARVLQIVAALCKVKTNRVTLPDDINQVELARSVMTCRQTVNRIFAKWNQRGIIKRSGANLVIDIAALEARVVLEP
jgi:CRP-like cAMP-binding protein